MRRELAIAGVLAAGCALLACDSLFGIQTFADPVLAEAGADATMDVGDVGDVGADATADTQPGTDSSQEAGAQTDADASVDAESDASVDADAADSHITVCVHPCILGQTRCTPGGLQTCAPQGSNCEEWNTPVPCSTGESCWGAEGVAYCCAGGASACTPSCRGAMPDAGDGLGNCGRGGNESCCTSLLVNGGTYLRSYDGVTNTDNTNPATVSDFQLDKFEVTVGRFRQFVAAWDSGFRPVAGAGIHAHLYAGQGLVDSSNPDGGSYEPGWDPIDWNSNLPGNGADWTIALATDPNSTWTNNPAAKEAFASNNITWFMAYAFCIWDGGFLPSETEWNYAAAGGGAGDGQRVYAWSVPPTSTTIDCTYANYQGCGGPAPTGVLTKGFGKYGQADLTGGEFEWTLDWYAPYALPCTDCAYMVDPGLGHRVLRGASWDYPAGQQYVADRVHDTPYIHYTNDGFRCARSP